jgi:hypothetical protein
MPTSPTDRALRTLAIELATAPDAAARLDAAVAEAQERAGVAALEAAAAHFRADPADAERLVRLEHTLRGWFSARTRRVALAAIGLTADELVPQLSARAAGRGRARRDPGRAAADLLASLVALGLAPRDRTIGLLRARIAERDKHARTNAAQALSEIDLAAGSAAVTLELGLAEDAALVEGAVRGVRAIAGDISMERCEPPVPLEALEPVLRKALAPSSPHVSSALEAVSWWGEAGHLIPVLETLARRGKPEARRFASTIVSHLRVAPERAPRFHVPPTPTTYTWRSLEGDACFEGMSILRELMREVGAVSEPGRLRAMTGPPVAPGAAPLAKFVRPSASVTPEDRIAPRHASAARPRGGDVLRRRAERHRAHGVGERLGRIPRARRRARRTSAGLIQSMSHLD